MGMPGAPKIPEQEKLEKLKIDIQTALKKVYDDEIKSQDSMKQDVVFRGFNDETKVREVLENAGINMSDLIIKVERKNETSPDQSDPSQGAVRPGINVEVYYKDVPNPIFQDFFESPDEKYEY